MERNPIEYLFNMVKASNAVPKLREMGDARRIASPQDQAFADKARKTVQDSTAYQNLVAIVNEPVGQIADISAVLRGMGDQETEDRIVGRIGAGLQGMAGTFAGPKAKTAPLDLLKRAETMKADGIPDRQIWADTGWTSAFPDGKWRFEIPDNKSFYRGSKAAGSSYADEVMLHPEYFDNYPNMKGAKIKEIPGEGGSYSAALNNLEIGQKNASSTTLHELQHAVQEREGFARGGSISNLNPFDLLPKEFKTISGTITRTNDGTPGFLYTSNAGNSRPISNEEALRWFGSQYGANPELEIYKRLAGEAEARLTQKRMGLTPEQRRDQYPIDQFDVPVDQQIVRFK